MIRNHGHLKGYPLYWYLSNKGRLKFIGIESCSVYKFFSVSHHLHHLFYGLGDGLSYSASWHMGVNVGTSFKHLNHSQFIRYKSLFSRRNMKFGYTKKL